MMYWNVVIRSLVVVAAAFCLLATGCGTNKFEREVQTEEAAIKLTNETIGGGSGAGPETAPQVATCR